MTITVIENLWDIVFGISMKYPIRHPSAPNTGEHTSTHIIEVITFMPRIIPNVGGRHPGACSMVALYPVAAAAEHLKVLGHRLATLRPRHDVIPLHLLKLEVPSASGADTLLPLIRRPLLRLRERPYVQRPLVLAPRKQVFVDAAFLLHVIILAKMRFAYSRERRRLACF